MIYYLKEYDQYFAEELNLSLADIVLVDWIYKNSEIDRIDSIYIEGEKYYEISYELLHRDLPFKSMNKRATQNRLKKLVELKLLKRNTSMIWGRQYFYALDENYKRLRRTPFPDEVGLD